MADGRDRYYRQPPDRDGRDQGRPLSENINPGYEDANFHQFADHHPMYTEAGPAIPLEERGEAAGFHPEESQGLRQRTWAATETPRDTAILLESLPSKQLEKIAGDIARDQSMHRRSKKRKSLHGTIRIPRNRDVSEEILREFGQDPDMMDEVDRELKGMTMNLANKKKIKKQLSKRRKRPGKIKSMKYSCAIGWMHFKYQVQEFTSYLKLWQGHLKKIEGHFGTGVLSYFLFLKWIFFINIPIFIFTLGFVIIPQVLYRWTKQVPKGYTQNTSFTGKELLTGAYWFTDTEMYYGYYTPEIFSITTGAYYNMKYAYLFTCGGYYILCLLILALSISRSYKKNYIEGSGAFNFYHVSRVFCGWDYGITSVDAAKLKHKGIYNELQEYLSGIKEDDEEKTMGDKCMWFFIRVFTNLNVLALIVGSGAAVYFISKDQSVDSDIPILSEMAMPLCVSGINLIIPFLFAAIGSLEKYEKPKTELYMHMLRTMVLKASTLGVLVYFWYETLDVPCWETFVGQEIYRLVIVDFIFILFTTLISEFLRRLVKENIWKSLNYPEFDIGWNTLSLIYSQTLCWLGTYFCPMLSLIMIIKLFIIFYVKRVSVIQNCKPSLRPWRASRAHTIFLGFLFIFFLLASAAFACAVIFVKPSDYCGPFVNHTTSYSVVTELVDSWKTEYSVLHTIIQVISSPGFIAGALVVLCVLTYYMRIVMVGHKEMVTLLRQQLSMEGRDKAYLLKMLQDASKKNKDVAKQRGGNRLTSPDKTNTMDSLSPGGRHFIRQLADSSAISEAGASVGTPTRGRWRQQKPE